MSSVIDCQAIFPVASSSGLLDTTLVRQPASSLNPRQIKAIVAANYDEFTRSSMTLGTLFPILIRCAGEVPDEELFGIRVWNALRRNRIASWSKLCELSVLDLLAVPHVGVTSVSTVIQAATVQSLRLASAADGPKAAPGPKHAPRTSTLSGAIGELRPLLQILNLDRVPASVIPTRLKPILDGMSWEELLRTDVEELMSRRSIGEGSVKDLLNRLQSLCATPSAVPKPVIASFREVSEGLHSILRWATQERDVVDVGGVVALNSSLFPLPPRIAGEWERIAKHLITNLPDQEMHSVIDDFLSEFDDRELEILRLRIWSEGNGLTLAELGERTDLSRERIRQLEKRAISKSLHRLHEPEFSILLDRVEELKLRMGSAIEVESDRYRVISQWATRDVAPHLRNETNSMLLWLAGPYAKRDGWLIHSESALASEICALLEAEAADTGFLDRDSLAEVLRAHGVSPDQQNEWMRCFSKFEMLDDGWFYGGTTVVETAVRLLRHRGRPMAVEELLQAIGRDASVRSVRQRLFEDARVHRVSKSLFALREWGLDEYTSVAQEMVEEIERSGGSVAIEDLVQRLSERHDISPTSVRMYSGRPMFQVDQIGNVSVRRENTYKVDSNLAAAWGCFELGSGRASWRIGVDRELLRGSGRRLPEALAGWLGLTPGNQLELSHATGSVLLSWPAWGQPTIGSLRSFVDGSIGSWLVLVFTAPTTVDIRCVHGDSQPTFELVADLMGIDWQPREALSAIGRVLSIEDEADNLAFRVRGSLARRGDEELVALVEKVLFE